MPELKPCDRVRLVGFENAYVPRKPTGTIHGFNGDWWGVVFDPDVRFTRPDKDEGSIPPRPYYGFTDSCFEVINDLPYRWGSREAIRYWLDRRT